MIRPVRLAASAAAALSAALLFVPGPASAMPMPPRTVKLQNADGTKVDARVFGDEFLSWAEDLEGYPLVWDRADGAWHYARRTRDGRLAPLKARPGKESPALLKLEKHLRPGKAEAVRAAQTRRRVRLEEGKTPYVRTSGAVQMLAVLAQFNCSTECVSSNQNPTFQPADFNAVFNGGTGSVKDFYTVASAGKLALTTTVYSEWVPLAHNDAYYAYNSQRYPEGVPEVVPVAEMLTEVVAYLDGKGFNFAPYADANGNIDSIGIIHIGRGYEDSGNVYVIHSHQMHSTQPIVTKGGQKIFGYHTVPEIMGTPARITPIGVLCHELGHALGLPDLYDTLYRSAGLGSFSLMAAGSWGGPNDDATVPVLPDVWSRVYLGWVNPKRVTASQSGLRLRPASSSSDALLLPSGMPANQYFLAENRAKSGYDQYLPSDGLAIYHVDDLMADNTPPDSYSHYRVTLEEADGNFALLASQMARGEANDLYPSATPANNAFTPTSTPNSIGYDLTTSQISVTNIARAAPDVTLDVGITVSGKLELGFTCLSTAECLSGNCVDGVCCDTACNSGICDACSRVMGAQVDGTCFQHNFACDDGDLCTEMDACSQGKCAGTPKSCPVADSCHETSACDPKTGLCSNVAKPENTACDDQDDCTTGDRCVSGVCKGTPRTVCPPPDQCHVEAVCENKKCGQFGQKNDLEACDDGNLCTTGDACMRGECKGDAVTCADPGDCYAPVVCDPKTGTCPSPVMRPDNSSCDDKNACTKDDGCKTGLCKGVVDPTVTDCPAPDQCHEAGKCSAQGECVAPAKLDGTACDNGDKCFRNQKCLSGVCTGSPVVCQSTDPCYDLSCVPASGTCQRTAKAEGEACVSKNPCIVNASCHASVCEGDPKECPAEDECHTGGTCNSMNGQCRGATVAPDGKKCTGGTCASGVCVLDPVDAGTADASAADAGSGSGGGGCGCASASSAPLALLAFATLLPLRRRRR